MSKGKTAMASHFPLGDFFRLGVYKASQGRVSRQVTFGVLAVTFLLGAMRLASTLRPSFDAISSVYLIAGTVLALGLWISYRIVNVPKFADFLIAVQAEMNKVTWPSKGKLIRSTMVVIFVILALAALLFGYDLLWKTVFTSLRVLRL